MIWKTLLLQLFLAVPALAYCPSFFQNQTACSCSDGFDGAIIKCSGPGGPTLVEKLKASHVDISELTMENADIVEIGPRAFRNLRIKKLVLDKNRIKAFHKDAFRGLENVLVELSIQQNRLTTIPSDALTGLRVLQVLNLRCNKIGNLTTSAFHNMSGLIDVNLGCNQICWLDSSAFAGVKTTLQNILLDSNCIGEFPMKAVEGMTNLIALHLKYNKINKLPSGSLKNLKSLSMLTLTGNNISSIAKDALVNTTSLRYLYLAENNLKELDSSVMSQFKEAQVVDLSFNHLEEVGADTFTGLESLQHMNLEANAITNLAPGAFAGTPLLLLWLPNNCISTINKKTFQGVPFLRQVSLANNNIHEIESLSFAHLLNLHTLDLSFNKIMSLQEGAINGNDNLAVRLQGKEIRVYAYRRDHLENPLVCTEDGFHVMNAGESINLTTEANLICRGDWQADTVDLCPKGVPRPIPPPCCVKPTPAPIVTTTRLTTTTTTTKMPEKMKSKEKSMSKPKEEKPVEEEEEEEYEDMEDDEEEGTTTKQATEATKTTTSSTTTKTTTTEMGEVYDEEEEEEEETEAPTTTMATKKRINMERFWRLAQRPNANSPFMKHQKKFGVNTAPKVLKGFDPNSEERSREQLSRKTTTSSTTTTTTTMTPAPAQEEEDEEYEDEEEEEEVTTMNPRKIPSRVLERQRMLASQAWGSPKSKSSPVSNERTEIDFDRDDQPERLQVDEAPIRA